MISQVIYLFFHLFKIMFNKLLLIINVFLINVLFNIFIQNHALHTAHMYSKLKEHLHSNTFHKSGLGASAHKFQN